MTRVAIIRPRRRQAETIEELLAPDRVWVTPSGCWLWLGGDDGSGNWWGRGAYGRILRPGTRYVEPVHRWAFRTFKGPIPEGFDIDHLCAAWSLDRVVSRKCINPDHLDAVPPEVNQQRKLLRRLGYVDQEDEREEDHAAEPYVLQPQASPLLAPGEQEDDLCL